MQFLKENSIKQSEALNTSVQVRIFSFLTSQANSNIKPFWREPLSNRYTLVKFLSQYIYMMCVCLLPTLISPVF